MPGCFYLHGGSISVINYFQNLDIFRYVYILMYLYMFIYLPRSCRLRIQETPGIMCSFIVEGALFITPILFVRMCVCVDVKRTLLIIPIHFVRICGDVKGALLITPTRTLFVFMAALKKL